MKLKGDVSDAVFERHKALIKSAPHHPPSCLMKHIVKHKQGQNEISADIHRRLLLQLTSIRARIDARLALPMSLTPTGPQNRQMGRWHRGKSRCPEPLPHHPTICATKHGQPTGRTERNFRTQTPNVISSAYFD